MCLRGLHAAVATAASYVLSIRHATMGGRAEQTAGPAKLLLNRAVPTPTGLGPSLRIPIGDVVGPNRALTITDQHLCWSEPVWSPSPESNRRPHPYHGTTRNRCAEPRFPRSRPTVRAEVMGSPSPKLCAHSPVMPCRGRSAGTGTRRSQTMKAPGQLPARKALPGSDGRVNGRRRARRYGRLTAPSPLAGGANVVFSRPLRGGLVDLRPWSYVGGVADSGRIPRGFAPPAVVPWPLGRRSAGGPARSSP